MLLAAAHIRIYDVIVNVDAFFSEYFLLTWPPLNANNLATLGRLEKLKIAARPARIDADDDVHISILKKCGVWVVYAERVTILSAGNSQSCFHLHAFAMPCTCLLLQTVATISQ